MKNLIYLFLAFLVTFSFSSCTRTVYVNRTTPVYQNAAPPSWAPAHGYRREMRYYYVPDINLYYDTYTHHYHYYDGRVWHRTPHLPAQYNNVNINNMYVTQINYNGTDPYRQNTRHQRLYPTGRQRVVSQSNTNGRVPNRRAAASNPANRNTNSRNTSTVPDRRAAASNPANREAGNRNSRNVSKRRDAASNPSNNENNVPRNVRDRSPQNNNIASPSNNTGNPGRRTSGVNNNNDRGNAQNQSRESVSPARNKRTPNRAERINTVTTPVERGRTTTTQPSERSQPNREAGRRPTPSSPDNQPTQRVNSGRNNSGVNNRDRNSDNSPDNNRRSRTAPSRR